MPELTIWQHSVLEWFSSLPEPYQRHLARFFWTLTTQDMSFLGLSDQELVQHFIQHILKPDIEVRILFRMVQMVAALDLIILNFPLWLEKKFNFSLQGTDNTVVNIEPKIWKSIEKRWQELKEDYFTYSCLLEEIEKIRQEEQ
jgi:hypothetical protein